MKEIDPSLAAYVEAEIIPRYAHFDRAHSTDHVRSVIDRSLALARRYDVEPDMVYVIAAYHDTGLAFGRERHHIDAGRILAEDAELRRRFDSERITTMREAVEDHRASSGHAPRSIYGRIVAEADRSIDTQTLLRRTVQYGLAHCPALTREEHFARCREHLQRKYAEGGYLRLWLPESDNARRLPGLRGGTPAGGVECRGRRRRHGSLRNRRPGYEKSGEGSLRGTAARRPSPESRTDRTPPNHEDAAPVPKPSLHPVGEILHVLHALVMVALGRPVVHPPAELVERGEALTTGPLVDETAYPRNRLVAVTGGVWEHNAVQRSTLRSSDGSLNGLPATKHIFSTSISGSKKRL